MKMTKIAALIFCLSIFFLCAQTADAAGASSAWCHDKALSLKTTCAKTSSLTVCKTNRQSYVDSCNVKFAYSEGKLILMEATALAQTLDAEAAGFAMTGAIIDPQTAKPFPCSQYYLPTNCITKTDCLAKAGIWQDNKCSFTPGVCFQDSHCPVGQFCDELKNKCVIKKYGGEACAASDACLSNKCLAGQCTCSTDAHCSIKNVCDKTKTTCVLGKYGGEACKAPAECQSEECLTGKCVCANTEQCPKNTFCVVPKKQCQPQKFGNSVCVKSEECLSLQCLEGLCLCAKDSHCPTGNVCNKNGWVCKKPICQDGIYDPPFEECDDGDGINNDECNNKCQKPFCGDGIPQYQSYVPGQLAEECDDGNNSELDQCSNNCEFTKCGDHIIQTSNGNKQAETCDDGNIKNNDGCSDVCQIECGDGIKNINESCDDGNLIDTDACTNFCNEPLCGDAIVWEGHEECDDGNFDNGDGCTEQCTLELVEPSETGDKTDVDLQSGFSQIDGQYCCNAPLTCMPPPEDKKIESLYVQKALQCLKQFGCVAGQCAGQPFCSNGKVEPGEECDDGNKTDGDGCDSQCKIKPIEAKLDGQDLCCTGGDPTACFPSVAEGVDDKQKYAADVAACLKMYNCKTGDCASQPVCVNGKVEAGEQCDDGNTDDKDACSNKCAKAICGDGATQTIANETCDDGNNIDTDDCTNKCTAAKCGDSAIQASKEKCDDGNIKDGDGCNATCQIEPSPAGCGDEKTNAPETCDDGNISNGDGCAFDCKKEIIPDTCKDKIIQIDKGEECDDGNTKNGDGCSITCKIEKAGAAGGAPSVCAPTCQTWEKCEDKKCVFLPGKCVKDADCGDQTKICDLTKHDCFLKKTCKEQKDCDAASQFCDNDKKICLPKLAVGETCQQPEYCASGLCTGQKCQCKEDKHCPAGQMCSAGVCVKKKPVGIACAKPEECMSNLCIDLICICGGASDCLDGEYCGGVTSQCQKKLAEGAECETKEQCLSGDCKIQPPEVKGKCTKPSEPVAAGAAPKFESIALPNPLNTEDPNEVVGNVIGYVIGLTGSLALIMFMYGGAMWVFSGGNDKNIQKGKDTLIWAAIGMAFVFSSYVLVRLVMKILGAE